MFSVPVMLAVLVLFAPALLGLLLFAAALEGRLLKRPEEAAARAREAARQHTAAAAVEPAPVPAPIPAHLPSQPPTTGLAQQPDRFQPMAQPAE